MADIAESFASSLSELTVNSKPHINMLTMLAEDHLEFAPIITQTVLAHLQKVRPELKLPALYLIDSIMKNVGKAYINLFTQAIVQHFTNTFEKVDEKTREQMFKLRQTWVDVFPAKTMYALDAKVQQIDPAWPCVSSTPSTVHLNPKFFKADMMSSPPTSSGGTTELPPVVKPPPNTESLREQMIMKQKMLLELQQQKLKLELMQTKARLEEQQKHLEKHSLKQSPELEKLKEIMNQEEANLKVMSKNLKKHMHAKFSKLQQAHKITAELKAQTMGEVTKLSTVPDSLLKPAALLELKKDDQLNIKPSNKPVVVKPPLLKSGITTSKSKITQLQQSMERQTQPDSSEEVAPPVRIAPVSSQLINAALSFGRNVRDPRIRQMSSRLETQINSQLQATPLAPTPIVPVPPLSPAVVPVKVPEPAIEAKSQSKSKKEKKSSSHQEKDKSSKVMEENNRHHSRTSNRSSERSGRSNSKSGKSSPFKKSHERNDKKSKAEELFSSTKSKSSVQTVHNSALKFHHKTCHIDVTGVVDSQCKMLPEGIPKTESSPKRTKFTESFEKTHWQESRCGVSNNDSEAVNQEVEIQTPDSTKAQNIKLNENEETVVSPEPVDNNDMPYEDIEKIIRHPDFVSRINRVSKVEESQDSSKSSDDSTEGKFNDIIRNPNKQINFEKIMSRHNEDKTIIKKSPSVLEVLPYENKGHIEERSVIKGEISEESVAPDSQIDNKDDVEICSSMKVESEIEKQFDNVSKELQIPSQFTKDPRQLNKTHLIQTFPQPESLIFQEEFQTTKFENTTSSIKEEITFQVKSNFEIQHDFSENFVTEGVVTNEKRFPEVEEYLPSNVENNGSCIQVNASEFNEPLDELSNTTAQPLYPLHPQVIVTDSFDSFPSLKQSESRTQSPKTIYSDKTVELMETVEEFNENITSVLVPSSPKKYDKNRDSPVHQEKRLRKGDKPLGTIIEQIAEAEKHAASPSPPPPPVISDKFKEIKQSSLSRLRRVGRAREDLVGSESPEPADIDLRTQIQPPSLTKDPKNEVLGLADKDVDLRNLPQSPTKKRPSMEKLLDLPPAKKSKAEVMDELFGSEDVDLRPVLCPPPPSPPPPPVISSSPPPDSAGEKLWARYKETKPDTYRAKYTPSRRDRAPSVDKFGRSPRFPSTEGAWPKGRSTGSYEDVDMRAPPLGTDSSYNQIIMQAIEQHTRGDLNDAAYKRVLSEVYFMREKSQLEEAQRRDEEETAQVENLDSISDDDISGGSLSGVENAPSPTESYSGGEEIGESGLRKSTTAEKRPITAKEQEVKPTEDMGDVDIRLPPSDIDIRKVFDFPPHIGVDERSVEEKPSRKMREPSPYTRKTNDKEKDRYHNRREEAKARKEKRAKRLEDERESRPYRKSRFSDEPWSGSIVEGKIQTSPESMEVDTSRVPPLPHYREPLPTSRDYLPEQHDSAPMRPTPWENQRMPGPSPTPWMTVPPIRGPPVIGLRPQERFMPPRWRQPGPGPIYEGERGPDSRFNRFGPPISSRFPVPLAPYEVPPTDPTVLKAIEEDPTKSINIDLVPRDIRFYGMTAVALMSWEDPREVTFQNGHRRVIIDDRDAVILHFNAPPVEVLIDGTPRRLRFGAPTRELYIDNQWYEMYFGGPSMTCDIAGQPHTVKLEGPPPPVRPGVQRKDLVLGKITLIIDAENFFSIYLDAKPQKFDVKGVSYIIRFVEALQKTVINGVGFKSDFGGLPRAIILNGSKHFFRLTALPRGVTPGFLTIINMEGGRLPSPPILQAPPQLPASLEQAVDFKSDIKNDQFLQPPVNLLSAPPRLSPEVVNVETTPTLLPTVVPPQATPAPVAPLLPPVMNPLDMLTNLVPSAEASRGVDYSYAVDNDNTSNLPVSSVTSTSPEVADSSGSTGEINVSELLQKLMASGIVPSLDQPKPQDKPVTSDASPLIKPVDFRKPETLKIRQTALVSHLYSGIQCNSCGVRFPPEQTMKYSQHLDWHFRQNRRDKDSSRMAQTRRYYYDVNDWVQFEEIEDLEERAQPWFEMQEGGGEEEEVPQVLVSVRSANYPEDAACNICHDKLESFYNEEKEEWQLRNAIDQDGKLVHPVCLEDQRAAAEKPIVVEDIDITEDDPKEETEEKKVEEEPAKVEDDDDIMEVTDIEFIKPVFPVEDLTVSDSESVADITEEKQEIEEKKDGEEVEDLDEEPVQVEDVNIEDIADAELNEIIENEQAEENTKEETEKEDSRDGEDDTQDDIVLLDKGEDSTLSTSEILEVVRKIKKDPDTLGGEYEDIGLDPDIEIKKEKGEVLLPSPVVDTTHATVTCLIDGNVEFEETPQQINVGGPPKIKINITKPNVQSAPKDSKENESEVPETEATSNTSLPATLALVNQPPPPGEEPIPQHVKPKIFGRKMQDLPPVLKGSEMSGLCSIM